MTRALNRRNTQITFVLPKAVGAEYATHVRLLSPQSAAAAMGGRKPEDVASTYADTADELANVTFKAVPSRIASPYARSSHGGTRARDAEAGKTDEPSILGDTEYTATWSERPAPTRSYASTCPAGVEFDVIHAHDWLTFPAGMAIAAATGKPLIVTSTPPSSIVPARTSTSRFTTSNGAACTRPWRVIVVSRLTRSIIERRYGIPSSKIEVVHNGVDNGHPFPETPLDPITTTDKIVLYLGRITMQKGARVLHRRGEEGARTDRGCEVHHGRRRRHDRAHDRAGRRVTASGTRCCSPGSCAARMLTRVYRMADVYVMPSVSEPFGIAALEASSTTCR